MKNRLLIFGALLSCDKAYALPQDWPCFGIEVEKYATIRELDSFFEYAYKGKKDGYELTINLTGFSNFPTLFANCGNSGCIGTITEIATNRTEHLRFFCEEYNDNYTKVVCNVGFGEEVIFDSTKNGNYVVNYCSDDKQKMLRFNVDDCEKCHCTMHVYDGRIKKATGEYVMACRKEGNKAHCFTYYGYEVWQNFQNEDDDFKNCVDLGL